MSENELRSYEALVFRCDAMEAEIQRLQAQNTLLKQEMDRRLDEAQVKLAAAGVEVVRLRAERDRLAAALEW